MNACRCFSPAVQQALKCYVYCLVDPRDNKIFYIGKGTGNRVFDHVAEAFKSEAENLKLSIIREIVAAGLQVRFFVIRHNLTADEALLIESTLIDMLTYGQFNTEHVLANIASGHHQWDEGIKNVDELNILYDCEPLERPDNAELLLVSLNRSFDQARAEGVYRRIDAYDITRRYWAIGKSRPDHIKYVLGVYKGVVRTVLRVDSYHWVDCAADGTPFKKPRCCFEGKLIDDSPYLNKDVSAYPFGSGGAVRYL